MIDSINLKQIQVFGFQPLVFGVLQQFSGILFSQGATGQLIHLISDLHSDIFSERSDVHPLNSRSEMQPPAILTAGPYLEDHPRTWMVNNHGDRKSPKDRVVGPLPNGLFMAYKWGLLTTY